jgi:hypothetical protein
MECFIALFETLFDEGAKYSVLLVAAIEKGANMPLAAQAAGGKVHRMSLGCHLSPQVTEIWMERQS